MIWNKEKALEAFFIIRNKTVENGYNKSYNFNSRLCSIKTVLENTRINLQRATMQY